MLQDVPASSASKVSSVMVRHSHQPTDNRDKIKQWIREQGSVETALLAKDLSMCLLTSHLQM